MFGNSAAGLGAGTTEAVMVVCPMEVVKIRLQAQMHSLADPLDIPKYRNAAHALFVILREEGPSTLYRGVALTALRQATNQGSCHPFGPVQRDLLISCPPSCQLYCIYRDKGVPAEETEYHRIAVVSGCHCRS